MGQLRRDVAGFQAWTNRATHRILKAGALGAQLVTVTPPSTLAGNGQSPDTAQHPVHQDRQAGDRAVGENGPVGGEPRDPQAGADVVA